MLGFSQAEFGDYKLVTNCVTIQGLWALMPEFNM